MVRCLSTWVSGFYTFTPSFPYHFSEPYFNSFFSLYLLHRATSATTHVVLGQFKTCVILLGGFFLFGSNPGITSILGAIVALAGMSAYTYLNLQSAKTSSFSITKSKLSKENGESHDGSYGDEHV